MICDKIIKLIYPTIRLMLYLDILDLDEFYYSITQIKLTIEQYIQTKCGNTEIALHYLLNFNNFRIQQNVFSPNKAYSFELQGITNEGNHTNTSHAFILINKNNKWIMLDSYIGFRGFTCTVVDLKIIVEILQKLEEKFDDDLWKQLTMGDHTDSFSSLPKICTDKVKVSIYEYNYDFSNIDNKYLEIINKARIRLNEEEIGISDDYLSLLDMELDPEKAGEYLDLLII